jgi:hypothetical protein
VLRRRASPTALGVFPGQDLHEPRMQPQREVQRGIGGAVSEYAPHTASPVASREQGGPAALQQGGPVL